MPNRTVYSLITNAAGTITGEAVKVPTSRGMWGRKIPIHV